MPDGTGVTLSMPGSNATNTTVYTYHSGSNYGLFSGLLVPTKAGTWTLLGNLGISYGSSIQVNSGQPIGGTIGYATAPFYQFDSVTVTTHIVDTYGNSVPNSSVVLSCSGSGIPTITQPSLTDVNGNTTIVEGPFNTTGNFKFDASVSGTIINGAWFSVLPPVPSNLTLNASSYICDKFIYAAPAFLDNIGLKDPISSNPAYITAHVTDSRGYPVQNVQVTFSVPSVTVKTSLPELWLDYTLGSFDAYAIPGSASTLLWSAQYYYNFSNNSYAISGSPTTNQFTVTTDTNGNAYLYFTVFAEAVFYSSSSYNPSNTVAQESIINATFNGNITSTSYTFITVY